MKLAILLLLIGLVSRADSVPITAASGSKDLHVVATCGGCDFVMTTEGQLVRSDPQVTCSPTNCTGTLKLNGLGLTSLAPDVFDSMTNLQSLDLGNNKLLNLTAGVFDTLTSLQALNLKFAGMATLTAGIFDNVPALEMLYMSNNKLQTLPPGIFDFSKNIKWLDLNNNIIDTLPMGVFDPLLSLERLDLPNNKLKGLPTGFFNKVPSLRYLWLYGNPFDCQITIPGYVDYHVDSSYYSLPLCGTVNAFLHRYAY
mmetsp:Transcript_31993/g.80545  ORF Transcript_31993/g.80545 Transcript_31993/m.80545 type:complete len:255 (+) Transcript_31993:53-817(+)